jgi:hypothetical protein
MSNLIEYNRGITLTAKELTALHFAIEMKINNRILNGCHSETAEILKGIERRIKLCKQKK